MTGERSVLHALLKLEALGSLVRLRGDGFVDVGGHETSSGECRFWLLASDELGSV